MARRYYAKRPRMGHLFRAVGVMSVTSLCVMSGFYFGGLSIASAEDLPQPSVDAEGADVLAYDGAESHEEGNATEAEARPNGISSEEDAAASEENGDLAESSASVPAVVDPRLPPVQSDSGLVTPRSGFFRAHTGARALTSESCQSGYIYSVSGSGTVYEVRSGRSPRAIAQVPNDYGRPRERSVVNALGISGNAEDLYAIRHWESSYDSHTQTGTWDYVIYRYHSAQGDWYPLNSRQSTGLPVPFVAGAVQLSTGDFYFGSYYVDRNNNGAIEFRLRRYDQARRQVVSVGSFPTGKRIGPNDEYNAAANGDMAFDREGNLFVARSGTGTTNIYSVSAGALARANGGILPARPTASIPADGTGRREAVNGVAFDSRGRVYLGDQDKAKRHDPLNFQEIDTFASLNASSDLASCESPTTVVVRKDLVERADPADQFTLTLRRNEGSGEEVASVTTSGNQVGLQSEEIGIFPVRVGTSFMFSETMAIGSVSRMRHYNTSWRCEVDGQHLASGQGLSGTVTIPDRPSARVECTLRNTPRYGSLTWEKVDGDDRDTRLEGSVWTLNGPLAPGRSQTVRDCVAGNASQCRPENNDTDPRAGYFTVGGLYLGRYTLREQTPPSGYEGTTQTFTQTLDVDSQQRSFGRIDNKKLVAQIQVKKEVRDPAGDKVADASGWTLAVDLESHLRGTLSPLKQPRDPWFGKHQVSDASGVVPERWTVSLPKSTTTQDIRITEAAKPANYAASIRCTSNKRQPIEGNGAGLNIPGVKAGENLTCVVTNKQLPGSAVWEKTDASGTYLSGSEWSVTTTHQGVISVQDCVTVGACQNGGDRDPRPGRFRLEGLKWQELTLEESAAPPGYRRDIEMRRRTIGENALQANFGRITNEAVAVPLLPLTGGMGADSFLIAGLGVLALAFATAFARHLQLSARGDRMANGSLENSGEERQRI